MYQAIDNTNIHYIDIKCLDNFFKRNFTKGISIEDNAAIIRRFDLNSDSRLNEEEFLRGMAAQEPFSKMLVRYYIKEEEKHAKQDKTAPIELLKEKDAAKLKEHKEALTNQLAKASALDRDYQNVSGLSPIKGRHPVDLYGVKSGLSYMNPIMLENINRIPEPEDFEDPVMLAKMGYKSPSKVEKSPLGASQAGNQSQMKGAAGDKTAQKGPQKLVVTNQGKKKGADFSQPMLPGSFVSKYSEYRVLEERNKREGLGKPDMPIMSGSQAMSQMSPAPEAMDPRHHRFTQYGDSARSPSGYQPGSSNAFSPATPHQYNKLHGQSGRAPHVTYKNGAPPSDFMRQGQN